MSYIISSGITSEGIVVTDETLIVSSGGTANNVSINSGGTLSVSSGGTANLAITNSGGHLIVPGGTVNYATMNAYGIMTIRDGTVNFLSVNDSGSIAVSSGGMANSATINSGGRVFVSSGGTANRTTINSGGWLIVSSGGTATDIAWTPCLGTVELAAGAQATFLNEFTGVYYGSGEQLLSYTTRMDSKTVSGKQCSMYVMSGGTAAETTVDSGGRLVVFGGTATGATVKTGGYLSVYSGAATEIRENGGYVDVADGATVTFAPSTASNLSLSGDSATVHSGTRIIGASIQNNGFMVVSSDGYANSISVRSAGTLRIASGGTVDYLIVSSGGLAVVSRGAIAAHVQWVPCVGRLVVEDGGRVKYESKYSGVYYGSDDQLLSQAMVMDSRTVSGGLMYVMSGGTATGTTVNAAGSMFISSGGQANDTLIGLFGTVVVSGGTANNTVLDLLSFNLAGMYGLYVLRDGIANNTSICYGTVTVSSGGQVNSTLVGLDQLSDMRLFHPELFVKSGGTANFTEVRANGSMIVSEGAAANFTSVSGYGSMIVSEGGAANFTTVSGGTMLVSGVANSTTVNYDMLNRRSGSMTVASGGIANYTQVANGYFNVFGGRANNTSVSKGSLFVSGGEMSGVTLYGQLNIYNGGVASSVTADSGTVSIASGGTAVGVTLNSGAIYVSFGGMADQTDLSGGEMNVIGGVADQTDLSGGEMNVIGELSGSDFIRGAAYRTAVGADCRLNVSAGGFAESTTVSGHFNVYNGGVANSVTVESGGVMYVQGGRSYGAVASASDVTVLYGGKLMIEGGLVNGVVVKDGGLVTVANAWYYAVNDADPGIVNGAVISDGSMAVSSGGIVNGATLSGGLMTVFVGGRVSSTVLKERIKDPSEKTIISGVVAFGTSYSSDFIPTELEVLGGGLAEDTVVNSSCGMIVADYGKASDITVLSGGRVVVDNSGTLTGRMTFESGATVFFSSGAILDFDLTKTSAGAAALVNDLSIISTPSSLLIPKIGELPFECTLTVDGTQENGTYILANGVSDENYIGICFSTTVKDTQGRTLGQFGMFDWTLEVDGKLYAFDRTDGTLSVTISSAPAHLKDDSFFPGCFAGGKQAMLAKQKENSIRVYAEGEVWGYGLTLDEGWSIAGVGDFNGDGRDDFLRVNDDGYVVGEMTKITGAFVPQVLNFRGAGWDILGTGDFDGNGTDDVLVANPTGASETVGLLGYWEGGVTWTLINGYSAEWECIATGDFNSDGKCDMLWRNSFTSLTHTYNAYCTWIMDDPVDWRMVSVANPEEWDFLCSGDFDGNGADDIAMINGEGIVGIWGVSDGYLSSWSILSAVDPSAWSLAGVGDFNGDGTDDIAWSSKSSGLTGYWQINDGTLTAWQNIATIA